MRFFVENFRSIKNAEIELTPITVLYGANGAGKSSLLYALLTLKNIALNPNQATSAFFNYVFANLGGFEAVGFDHRKEASVMLAISIDRGDFRVTYAVEFRETEGSFSLQMSSKHMSALDIRVPVSFPYPQNAQEQGSIDFNEESFTLIWNGATAQVQSATNTEQTQKIAGKLAAVANAPISQLRQVAMVPLRRGFTKPQYAVTPLTPMLATEDEVATFIAGNKYLQQRISFYLEKTVGRDFRVHIPIGSGTFSLDATDRLTGVGAELVNEGFGVNQLVYILARCLHEETKWIAIEEPEIHMHPTAIRNMAKTLAEIVREEGKNLIISTHSDNFVSALLALVAEGELKASDLSCYFVHKDKKKTIFKPQEVNEKGQLEDGLSRFVEGELEDLEAVFKADGTVTES